MTGMRRIGAVVLTYNSVDDLPECLEGLLAQAGVDLRLIVVDNASAPEARSRMETIFQERAPGGVIVDAPDATAETLSRTRKLFVRNDRNAGYSAGNNIGARLAVAAGCEAVLIVNPDVRIADPDYLARLSAGMFTHGDCMVAASRIVGLSGLDEHPFREPTFWEELLWIRQYGPRWVRPRPWVLPPVGPAPIVAEKVHGCCLLISADFLESSGYLDEAVFLYCEEPILAARVRAQGGRLMVFPELQALHAHVASAKGNSSRRMLHFIRSRLYYLDTYAGYGRAARCALHASYGLLRVLHAFKAKAGPA